MSYGKTCWLPAAVLFRALGERSRIIIFTRLARPTSPPVRGFRKPRRPCQLLEAASAVQQPRLCVRAVDALHSKPVKASQILERRTRPPVMLGG